MKKTFNLFSHFDIKAVSSDNEDSITIEGYANTVTKDRMGDVIAQEAWTKGGLDNYLKNPIVLAYHDHRRPIGGIVDMHTNEKGLYVVAEISKAAGDVYQLVKSGILKTFSVGFSVKDADYDDTTDIFVIKDLELLEVSVVSVPANADSLFSLRKSFANSTEYENFKNTYNQKGIENMKTEEELRIEKEALEAEKKKFEEEKAAQVVKDAEVKASALDVETLVKQITDSLESKAKEAKEKEMADIKTGDTGAEQLIKALTERLDKNETETKDVLDGLRTELKEKSDELQAITKSKMSFEEKNTEGAITAQEKDTASLLSIIMGKGMFDTDFGKGIIQKSGAQHIPGSAGASDWEKEWSTRIHQTMRQSLIVEPLFSTIAMNTYAMQIPVNPDAGLATWISTANMRGANSTGTAVDHALTDTTLKAEKLAAKAYLGYEEEEDAILPILPVIQDAIIRSMARESDRTILRGDTAISPAECLWDGLATIATTDSKVTNISAASGKATIDTLAAMRKDLGIYGLDPSALTFVVSTDVYYDLLDDPDFRTVDMVGADRATIISGQIGTVGGSPVIVSGEFAAKADTAIGAVCVYKPNFMVGSLRGMMVERDRDIEQQKNIIVASRRLGFIQLTGSQGVSTLTYTA